MSTLTKITTLSRKLNAYEEALSNTNRRSPRTLHASGYIDCGRMQAYGLLGYGPDGLKEFVPSWSYSAAYGEAIHGVIQKKLVDSDMVISLPNFDYDHAVRSHARSKGILSPAVEIPLNEYTLTPSKFDELKRYRIGGRVDGILKGTGKPLVLEIKTIAGKYLTMGYQKYYLDKLYHYESQTQLYMHFLELDRAVILVVNRDTSEFDEYLCSYDPMFVERELSRIEAIVTDIAVSRLPEPEPNRGPCKFCDWQKQCPASNLEKNNGGYKHV